MLTTNSKCYGKGNAETEPDLKGGQFFRPYPLSNLTGASNEERATKAGGLCLAGCGGNVRWFNDKASSRTSREGQQK
ncbi:hypothetical protein JCM15764A_20400 [Geotalea toluenoxydans]